MAIFSAPKPPHPQLPVIFNVSGVVGAAPAKNLREDVLLVQFAFKVIADLPPRTESPEVAAAAKAVKLTGIADTATINAIRALQQFRADSKHNPSKVVDGRVSPARGGYNYGAAIWTIANLNNMVKNRAFDIWPRIDKIPGCPVELRQLVSREVTGVRKGSG
ncbi:MAG: hypothetical protein OEQ39_16425 [Gammaproteobacteria bacterium]|nr:hypothetical protein [Gammaproteobacteria bacterium]MDH3468030.1 hypothetical protein [Gammaproteobacteria bacterium]